VGLHSFRVSEGERSRDATVIQRTITALAWENPCAVSLHFEFLHGLGRLLNIDERPLSFFSVVNFLLLSECTIRTRNAKAVDDLSAHLCEDKA